MCYHALVLNRIKKVAAIGFESMLKTHYTEKTITNDTTHHCNSDMEGVFLC